MCKTPRPLQADAYTIGSSRSFESPEAQDWSTYYLTFRKGPSNIAAEATFDHPYRKDDNRIVFCGLQCILDRLLADPITHEEIDETIAFLRDRKISTKGLRPFNFDEAMWRRVVDDFEGRLPLKIEALPEGSVVYPGVPVIRVSNTVEGFGPLAAWFESRIMHVWAATERATAARHWLLRNQEMIAAIENISLEEALPQAMLMLHDFGDRAAICAQESEDLGMVHLYSFSGTDTFSGAYQAWKNGAVPGIGVSVDALAHRIVQGFANEADAYTTIYNQANPDDIISMVADCYDFRFAVQNYLLPLAQKSVTEDNGKVVVCRPDSGDALEQILFVLNLAVENGLFIEKNGYKYMTTLRVIEGDGMTFESMTRINEALIAAGFAPHGCLIYGVGGALRNNLARDHFSTKYALCAVGENNRPVLKLSEVFGKQTLPLCHVTKNNGSILLSSPEEGEPDSMRVFYENGLQSGDSFPVIQNRILHMFNLSSNDGVTLSENLTLKTADLIQGIQNERVSQPN